MKRSPWAECHPAQRHYALGLCKECYRKTRWEREGQSRQPWRKDWERKRVALLIKLTSDLDYTVDEALKLLDRELPMPQERRGARGKANA